MQSQFKDEKQGVNLLLLKKNQMVQLSSEMLKLLN